MANEQNFSNAFFKVNAFDLSAYVTDLTLNYGSESLDVSTMGTLTRKHKGGVKDWSFDIGMAYDKSTSGPECLLFGLEGTTVCVEVRPVNVCSSANNPIYWGIGTLFNKPIGGAYGSFLKFNTSIASYGDLTRASSSA